MLLKQACRIRIPGSNHPKNKTIRMKKLVFPFIAALMLNLNTQAQLPADSGKIDPSLKGQYEFMLSRSKTLNGYKLVNPNRLSILWKNAGDSLRNERRQLSTAKQKIAEQEKNIATLNKQITGTESSLASSQARLDEISFLGIPFSKSTYNMIVWTLIIILTLALVIVILRSAKHIHEAKYRSGLYEEIAQEYQAYKVKANEKEKKLARELQDERNKLDELNKR